LCVHRRENETVPPGRQGIFAGRVERILGAMLSHAARTARELERVAREDVDMTIDDVLEHRRRERPASGPASWNIERSFRLT